MSYLTQKTIKNKISFSGIALHSGLNVNVCLVPARPNTGIIFKRVDQNKNNFVYPNFMNVTNTSLNTTIETSVAIGRSKRIVVFGLKGFGKLSCKANSFGSMSDFSLTAKDASLV